MDLTSTTQDLASTCTLTQQAKEFGDSDSALHPPIFVEDGIHSEWNYNQKKAENGKLPGANSYGTHPFWMYKAQTKKADETAFVGIFLNNLNAMGPRCQDD